MRTRYILAIAVLIPPLILWLSAVMIARSRARVDRCPVCSSNRIRPSWPKVTDVFLNMSAIAAFRCEACLKRFYARKALVKDPRLI
jgi:hypothetical protein